MQCFKKINQKWLHVFHHLKYLYFFQLVYHFLKILLPEIGTTHVYTTVNTSSMLFLSGIVVQAPQCKEKEKGKSGVKDTYESTA